MIDDSSSLPASVSRFAQLVAGAAECTALADAPSCYVIRCNYLFARRTRRLRCLARKRQLLRHIVQKLRPAYLTTRDSPRERGVQGSWSQVDVATWEVPADVARSDLEKWLLTDGWIIHCAPRYVSLDLSLIDSRRPEGVLQFMRAHSIWVLVESFHDGDPWWLYLPAS